MNWQRKPTEHEIKTDKDIAELKDSVKALKLMVEDLEKSVLSLIGLLPEAGKKEEDEPVFIKTPKPQTWSARKTALVASRERKDFVQKIMESKNEEPEPEKA